MRDRSARNSHAFRGILLVMCAVSVFSVLDFFSKYLTRSYPIPMVVWARFTFHLLFIVVVLGLRSQLSLVRTARPAAQIVRGLLLAISSIFFVTALKYMPLAETSAIAYLSPVFVIILSVFFLKEKIELARWLAVVCGFAGVLAIVRPGSEVFTWAAVLPIANALSFAAYQILTRRLAGVESPYTSIFYAGLIGMLLMSLVVPFVWVTPQNGAHVAMFVLVGMLGGLGHLVLIKAFAYAPASRLAPYGYSQLIWVAIIGYIAFGDFPDHWSQLGIAILVGSGIYIAKHQRASERALLEEESRVISNV
jgi:drug/metabolite transporter (DMT)-like permease